MRTEISKLFETACEGEENPTAMAIQCLSAIAESQLTDEQLAEAKQAAIDNINKIALRMDDLSPDMDAIYEHFLGHLSMLLVGLSLIAEDYTLEDKEFVQ